MTRALLLAAALAACKPAAKTPESLPKAFEGLQRSPLCAQNLPMEWASTWPVPTETPGRYVALFYALDRSAADASGLPRVRVTEPRGRALFSADGKVAECTSSPVDLKPLEGERYPAAAMELEEDAFEAAENRLLVLTQQAADMYWGRKPEDKAVLEDYRRQSVLLREPALAKDYRDANPKFEAWITSHTR